jgi:hypothetical protein
MADTGAAGEKKLCKLNLSKFDVWAMGITVVIGGWSYPRITIQTITITLPALYISIRAVLRLECRLASGIWVVYGGRGIDGNGISLLVQVFMHIAWLTFVLPLRFPVWTASCVAELSSCVPFAGGSYGMVDRLKQSRSNTTRYKLVRWYRHGVPSGLRSDSWSAAVRR